MARGDWWRHGAVYQIYPRSFQDSNGDGIGDLPGITSRLDHLNDGTPGSLGIDAIWLSPFYPSPMADFGYDISDYADVHPDYGTLADFDELLAQAHRRDIRVIVDFVPNHTSDRHPWFVASRSSRDDPHRDWYVWADPGSDGGPPNNWRSYFPAVGSAWTFDPATGQYYLHSFAREQPDLNWWNPDVRAAMHDVLRFWLDRGVDGFRIDVAHKMSRDPELLDNPPELYEGGTLTSPRRDEDWPEVHVILREFRRLLDEYGDRMAIGEVAIFDPEWLVGYFGDGLDELNLVFNFSFLHQPWSADAFRGAVDDYEAVLPAGAWPVYTLSNHDVPRARSRHESDREIASPTWVGAGNPDPTPADVALGMRRMRLAAMLLLTLRGTPFLYYGEEIGQADGQVPPERILDVDGRDPERTPMQWDGSPGAGFTTGEPWLPVGREASAVNVAAQRDDPRSLLSLYRRLAWYRKGSRPLLEGSYRAIGTDPDVFAYVREASPAEPGQSGPGEASQSGALPEAGRARLLVALNFGDGPVAFDAVAHGLPGSGWLELSTDADRTAGPVSLGALDLGANEGVVIRVEAASGTAGRAPSGGF